MPTWISVIWNFISDYFSKGKIAAEFLMLCRWAAGAKMYLYNIFISVPLISFTKFYEKLMDSRKEKFFIIPSDQPIPLSESAFSALIPEFRFVM